jgi:hypothetical protein
MTWLKGLREMEGVAVQRSVRLRELLFNPCGAVKVVRPDRSTTLILPTCGALWVGSTSSVSMRCRLGLELRGISASRRHFCECCVGKWKMLEECFAARRVRD